MSKKSLKWIIIFNTVSVILSVTNIFIRGIILYSIVHILLTTIAIIIFSILWGVLNE